MAWLPFEDTSRAAGETNLLDFDARKTGSLVGFVEATHHLVVAVLAGAVRRLHQVLELLERHIDGRSDLFETAFGEKLQKVDGIFVFGTAFHGVHRCRTFECPFDAVLEVVLASTRTTFNNQHLLELRAVGGGRLEKTLQKPVGKKLAATDVIKGPPGRDAGLLQNLEKAAPFRIVFLFVVFLTHVVNGTEHYRGGSGHTTGFSLQFRKERHEGNRITTQRSQRQGLVKITILHDV